jgi:transposase
MVDRLWFAAGHDSLERMMTGGGLFDDLPTSAPPVAEPVQGRPRMREPVRDQIELRAMDIDSLIGSDHPARVIWGYVERLDLGELEDAIKAREGTPGGPAIAPRLLLALWLYATSEGVGSARALSRLIEHHDAYRWLAGGISVNYHTLSDFRVGHGALLDRLLAENVAALCAVGAIEVSALAQDGVRVRASAGAASFRRRGRLQEHLAAARELVERLKREVDENSDASNRRMRAAKERAARERAERIEAALNALDEVTVQRAKRKLTTGKTTEKRKEPRASTTDPQARVMKMADGGFRPAWNVQVISAAGEQFVIDVNPLATGSDRGLLRPSLEAVRERLGRLPDRHLGDGGFTSAADIEWAHGEGIDIYCPPTQSKHGTDPYQPRRDDGPGVLAWRSRMASPEGQAIYRVRSICECIHARWRNWNLIRLNVRGITKVKAAMLWFALANNIIQGHRRVAA